LGEPPQRPQKSSISAFVPAKRERKSAANLQRILSTNPQQMFVPQNLQQMLITRYPSPPNPD
jgi:hypothetical protein